MILTIDTMHDGGSIQIQGAFEVKSARYEYDGTLYIDRRIGTKTPNTVWEGYPTHGVQITNPEVVQAILLEYIRFCDDRRSTPIR